MRGVLRLTLIRRDMEFLKYLVSNHSVDVNGELLPRCTCNVTPLCACVHAYTLVLTSILSILLPSDQTVVTDM